MGRQLGSDDFDLKLTNERIKGALASGKTVVLYNCSNSVVYNLSNTVVWYEAKVDGCAYGLKIRSGAVAQLGLVVLLLTGLVAFCLNLAVVFLIKNASSLVLTLAGVVKDILIISISMFLFSAPVSFIQAFGYTFAIAGLVLYKRYKSNREYYEQFTFQWAMGGCKPQHKYNRVPPADGADADD